MYIILFTIFYNIVNNILFIPLKIYNLYYILYIIYLKLILLYIISIKTKLNQGNQVLLLLES